MKSLHILAKQGIYPVHKTDFCIGNRLIGSHSKEHGKTNLYKAACIMIEDCGLDYEDFQSFIITKEEFKEIALSCDTFYTNFGVDIHSHDLKTQYPYNTCKLVRVSSDE